MVQANLKERELALAQREKEGAETLRSIQERSAALETRQKLFEKV